MKKKFEKPILTIDVFDYESIVTSSNTEAMNQGRNDVTSGSIKSENNRTVTSFMEFVL